MDALIFIDTNIFLDFYRVRNDQVGLGLLKRLDQHHDQIITGNQVEMEYKKNRQRVILDSLGRIKAPEWAGLAVPAFLAETQPSKALSRMKKEVDSQHKKIKKQIEKILSNPANERSRI